MKVCLSLSLLDDTLQCNSFLFDQSRKQKNKYFILDNGNKNKQPFGTIEVNEVQVRFLQFIHCSYGVTSLMQLCHESCQKQKKNCAKRLFNSGAPFEKHVFKPAIKSRRICVQLTHFVRITYTNLPQLGCDCPFLSLLCKYTAYVY